MGKKWTAGRGALVPVLACAWAVALAGCSTNGTADPALTPVPVPSASSEAPPGPEAPPATVPSPSSVSPVPAATGAAAPTPGAPAPAESVPPPGFTEAPQLPQEQSDAGAGFTACAQAYQQRIQSITLGGAITPLLLEQWDQAYQDASAVAAEGDLIAAEEACRALQREMDTVLR